MLEENANQLVVVTVFIGIFSILFAMIVSVAGNWSSIEHVLNANTDIIGRSILFISSSILLVIWRKQIGKLILFVKKEIEKLIIVVAF